MVQHADEQRRFREAIDLLEDNPRQAKLIFESLAMNGNKRAMYELGECYYHGKGVGKDRGNALVWYKRAAEEPNPYPMAVYELGRCYQYGWGTEPDIELARAYYARAWELGVKDAVGDLALCAPDQNTYLNWLTIGDQVNEPRCVCGIGLLYKNGEEGFEQSNEIAFQYFKRAAEQNHVGALSILLQDRCLGVGDEFEMRWVLDKCLKLAETDTLMRIFEK